MSLDHDLNLAANLTEANIYFTKLNPYSQLYFSHLT